jgi:hypothetical protein
MFEKYHKVISYVKVILYVPVLVLHIPHQRKLDWNMYVSEI